MRNHLTDLEKIIQKLPSEGAISAPPGELVELDYVVAHRHKSIASRMVVLPLSPGPTRAVEPPAKAAVSKTNRAEILDFNLQTLTTALSLFFFFIHTLFVKIAKRVDSALIR